MSMTILFTRLDGAEWTPTQQEVLGALAMCEYSRGIPFAGMVMRGGIATDIKGCKLELRRLVTSDIDSPCILLVIERHNLVEADQLSRRRTLKRVDAIVADVVRRTAAVLDDKVMNLYNTGELVVELYLDQTNFNNAIHDNFRLKNVN